MGEVGFSRDEFLHVLKWWEIKAIIDGYRKRERTFCTMIRWSTFHQMCTGMADLKKAGIYDEYDLLRFPWEEEREKEEWSDEDIQRERDWLIEENNKIQNSDGQL